MNTQTDALDAPVEDGRVRIENFRFMQSQRPRAFKWLRIDANDNCNLKCTYCRIPRSSSLIDPDELKHFLNEKVISVESLQFGCGMEPTVDARLADIIEMAVKTPAKPTLRHVLQTNGTKLHKHDHKKMARAGLTRLSVSIDSLDEEVHASQRGGSSVKQIISNLEEFRRNCPDIEIQFICVVTKASLGSCAAIADFALELGATRVAFREMMHVDNDPVADPEKVAPLIVPPGKFAEMTAELEPKIRNRGTEFVFLPISTLHQTRFDMRKDAFPENEQGQWQRKKLTMHPRDNYQKSADKPILAPMFMPANETELLAGKQFFALRGFVKSGTNWVARLLNLHPDISCAGEFNWANTVEPFKLNIDQAYLLREKPGLREQMLNRLERMMKECLVLANHPSATWVGDRSPVRISPTEISGSKIIHLIRDGRDVLISRAHQFFSHPEMHPQLAGLPAIRKRHLAFKEDPQFFIDNPNELLACSELVKVTAQDWSDTIVANEELTGGMEQACFLELRYEKIHNDTEASRTEMYNFFEVDPGLAGPLAFNTKPGFEKESPDKFLRKGIVGDWQNYFDEKSREAFNKVAGETLTRLGYTGDLNW